MVSPLHLMNLCENVFFFVLRTVQVHVQANPIFLGEVLNKNLYKIWLHCSTQYFQKYIRQTKFHVLLSSYVINHML